MISVAGRLTASARVKYSAGRMPGSTDIKAAPALGAAQGSAMWAPQIAVCWWCLHNLTSSFSASWQGCKPHLNHSSSTSQRLKDEARELLSLPAQADISHFSGLPSTPHTALLCHSTQMLLSTPSQGGFPTRIPTNHSFAASTSSGCKLKCGSAVSAVSTTEKPSSDTPMILNI